MASAQVVETSVANNSSSQDSNHPDDLSQSRYIDFVDERDFKEVSVVGKRKSKKNRALGFVLTVVSVESSSEDASR